MKNPSGNFWRIQATRYVLESLSCSLCPTHILTLGAHVYQGGFITPSLAVHDDLVDRGSTVLSLLAPEASEEVTVCKCIAVVTTVNLQASPPRNSRLNSMKYIHGMKSIMTMLMIRSPHTTHSASSAIHQVWLLLRLPADSTSNPVH